MGSPPRTSPVALEVNKNQRLLRPPSYADVTSHQQTVELGLAVAASAAVPGIFYPLALSRLYDQGIRVELVDGGVHDNQGIQGLLDEGCTHLVVSDASGQMDNESDPSTRVWAVLSRTNTILMDRVREEELFDLLGGGEHHAALLHLRKGLEVEEIPWIGPDGSPVPAPALPTAAGPSSAAFGVDPRVQDLLSKIRTDLDSFTDIEAYSLVADGYLMADQEFRASPGFTELTPPTRPAPGQWRFHAIRAWLLRPTETYLKHLNVAKEQLFKVFRLSPPTALITALIALLVLWLLWRWQGEAIRGWWNSPILKSPPTYGHAIATIALLALGFVPWASRAFARLRFLRSPSDFFLRLVVRGVLPALASVFVGLHLLIFDRLFLWLGRIDRLR